MQTGMQVRCGSKLAPNEQHADQSTLLGSCHHCSRASVDPHPHPSVDPHPHLSQALQGGIAEQTLEAPAGAALVQECVQLYNRLAALTRLDDPALLPAVSGLGERIEGGTRCQCSCWADQRTHRSCLPSCLTAVNPCLSPLPQDSSLCWVATRFLQQQHPLVAALKRQVSSTLPAAATNC